MDPKPDDKPSGDSSTTAPPGGDTTQTPDPNKSASPDGQKPDDKKIDAPKPPDKYEFKFKGPDGKDVELDPATVTAFEPVFKELGLTQEGLGKLLPLYHAELARQDKEIADLYTAQRESWEAGAKADKDFGGNNYDENVKVAQTAIARFGSQALKDLLNETGLGNHVEVLKFFEKVGRQISEDKPVGTKPAGGITADQQASKLFDHPTSQGMNP